MKRSGIIAIIAAIAVIGLIGLKLSDNRKEFRENVAFAQRKIEKIPVSVETATMGVLAKNVRATGTLEASDVLNLVSETQGKIISIYKEKGDRISKGEVIAKVDDEVISANVLTAEANYEQMQKDVERLTRLSEQNAVTRHDLEQATIGLKKAKADLISAKKALGNTSIKAPIAGYINNDYITVGQLLGPGSPVCEIVDNSKLKLNVRVSESDVYKLEKGQTVDVLLSVFPDRKFAGKITAIAEKADGAMKFNVEITLENDVNAHLRSGLYAEAEFNVKNEEKIILSKSAIVGSMEDAVVYVAADGKAVKRSIIIGQSNDKQVEVLSGINPDEKVIISGQLNLKDGDEINVVR